MKCLFLVTSLLIRKFRSALDLVLSNLYILFFIKIISMRCYIMLFAIFRHLEKSKKRQNHWRATKFETQLSSTSIWFNKGMNTYWNRQCSFRGWVAECKRGLENPNFASIKDTFSLYSTLSKEIKYFSCLIHQMNNTIEKNLLSHQQNDCCE